MPDIKVKNMGNWSSCYWSMNIPVQMWKEPNGWKVVNYMPRKETCCILDELVTPKELPQFCKNTATILRNLAALFEAMGEGKVDNIYYADKSIEDAIADTMADRERDDS